MTFDEAHRRIKRGDRLALVGALDQGLDPNLANQFSWTLLMLTAIQGNVQIAEALVSRGAKVDSVNNFGETALSLAAHAGHERFVRWLLDRGASSDCKPHGWTLAEWIATASGLPPEKIVAITSILGVPLPNHLRN